MSIFPTDPLAFGDGRWAPNLKKALAKSQWLPGLKPETTTRRYSGRSWVQFEPEQDAGPLFWMGKPAVMSSDAAIYVGYYVERGYHEGDPESRHKPATEKITPAWHWHGFVRCLNEPHLRQTLADSMLPVDSKRRTIWIDGSGVESPKLENAVDVACLPFRSADDLAGLVSRIDTIPSTRWINVVVGARFSREECAERQAEIVASLRVPLQQANDMGGVVKMHVPHENR